MLYTVLQLRACNVFLLSCYFLLNYARYGEARCRRRNGNRILLFSFELCSQINSIVATVLLLIIPCYFLLNYALCYRTFLPEQPLAPFSCYFLLNYALAVAAAAPAAAANVVVSCYFLLNYASTASGTLSALRETWPCYFLLNYAEPYNSPDAKHPWFVDLLFSFELCVWRVYKGLQGKLHHLAIFFWIMPRWRGSLQVKWL